MAKIEVDTNQIQSVLRTFRTTIDDWKERRSLIWSALDEINDMWDGDANDEFNALTNAERPNFENLETALENYYSALDKAAQEYEDAETEVRNIVNR